MANGSAMTREGRRFDPTQRSGPPAVLASAALVASSAQPAAMLGLCKRSHARSPSHRPPALSPRLWSSSPASTLPAAGGTKLSGGSRSGICGDGGCRMASEAAPPLLGGREGLEAALWAMERSSRVVVLDCTAPSPPVAASGAFLSPAASACMELSRVQAGGAELLASALRSSGRLSAWFARGPVASAVALAGVRPADAVPVRASALVACCAACGKAAALADWLPAAVAGPLGAAIDEALAPSPQGAASTQAAPPTSAAEQVDSAEPRDRDGVARADSARPAGAAVAVVPPSPPAAGGCGAASIAGQAASAARPPSLPAGTAASAAPVAAAWRDAVAALPPSADVGSCVKCGGALRQAPAGDEDPRFRAVGVAAAGSCDLVVSLGDPRSDPACLRVWQGVAAACPRVGVHTRGGGALEPSDAGEAADAWSDAGGRDRDRDSPMGGGEGSAAVPGADWRDGVRDVWVEAEPSAGAEQLCRALQAGQSGETARVAHGGVAMMAARATVLRAQAAKAAAAVPAAGAAGLRPVGSAAGAGARLGAEAAAEPGDDPLSRLVLASADADDRRARARAAGGGAGAAGGGEISGRAAGDGPGEAAFPRPPALAGGVYGVEQATVASLLRATVTDAEAAAAAARLGAAGLDLEADALADLEMTPEEAEAALAAM